jgi:hypothetical protein
MGPDDFDDQRIEVMEQEPRRRFIPRADPLQARRQVKSGLGHILFCFIGPPAVPLLSL